MWLCVCAYTRACVLSIKFYNEKYKTICGHSINFKVTMYKRIFIQNLNTDIFYRNEQTSMKTI